MVELFQRMVLERVPEVYTSVKNDLPGLGPDGYCVAMARLLGYTPSHWETDELFRQSDALTLHEFQDIVRGRLLVISADNYVHDMFTTLDADWKGYITLLDIENSWNKTTSQVTRAALRDAFRLLTPCQVLNYDEFYVLGEC